MAIAVFLFRRQLFMLATYRLWKMEGVTPRQASGAVSCAREQLSRRRGQGSVLSAHALLLVDSADSSRDKALTDCPVGASAISLQHCRTVHTPLV